MLSNSFLHGFLAGARSASHSDAALVMEDHVQQRRVYLDFAVVLNET
jgi:hypothetical protein